MLSAISSVRSNRLNCVEGLFLNVVSKDANSFRKNRQRTGAVQHASRVRPSSGAFASVLIAIVSLYRYFLSPAMRFLFGSSGACRYTPSCSCYANEAFERHGALGGLRLTISRLFRCHPWGSAGYDPVPHNLNPTRNPNLFTRLRLRLGLRSGGEGGER
jgi:uncharacterized protein